MELSVIIPTKNDEHHIEETVRSVFDYLTKHKISHEIIVVANRSTDKTVPIINELSHKIHSLKLLNYPKRGGKGFAVREGMLYAKGEKRLFMDADNSTTIDNLHQFLPYFEKGYGVVIASLRLKGSVVEGKSETGLRKFLGRVSGLYTRIVLLPGIKDTQRGFKMVTAQAAEDIFTRSRIDKFGFDMEMLALARKFGYKIKEVPIHWHNDAQHSSVHISDYIQVLMDTLRIKWWLITGVYNKSIVAADIETEKAKSAEQPAR